MKATILLPFALLLTACGATVTKVEDAKPDNHPNGFQKSPCACIELELLGDPSAGNDIVKVEQGLS